MPIPVPDPVATIGCEGRICCRRSHLTMGLVALGRPQLGHFLCTINECVLKVNCLHRIGWIIIIIIVGPSNQKVMSRLAPWMITWSRGSIPVLNMIHIQHRRLGHWCSGNTACSLELLSQYENVEMPLYVSCCFDLKRTHRRWGAGLLPHTRQYQTSRWQNRLLIHCGKSVPTTRSVWNFRFHITRKHRLKGLFPLRSPIEWASIWNDLLPVYFSRQTFMCTLQLLQWSKSLPKTTSKSSPERF
jgi:hypothetical protein